MAYIIFSFVFLALALWFMFIYYSNKDKKWVYDNKFRTEGLSVWSFRGFWYRNRYTIYLYGSFVFAILFLGFLVIGVQML